MKKEYNIIANCPYCKRDCEIKTHEQGSLNILCEVCEEIFILDFTIRRIPNESLYKDELWLNNAYGVEGRTIADIARDCGVTPMTIWGWLNKHGIETRSRGRPLKGD